MAQVIVKLCLRSEHLLLLVCSQTLSVVSILELTRRYEHGEVVVEHDQLPSHVRSLEGLLACKRI